jgi:hypothetical protein
VAANVLVALILALVGLAMAAYLLMVRSVPVGNSGPSREGSMALVQNIAVVETLAAKAGE